MDRIKVPNMLLNDRSQCKSSYLAIDIKTSTFSNARYFGTSSAVWRRSVPRLKLKHRPVEEQKEEFMFDPHEDSEQLQFVKKFKRPVRQAGDEEIIAKIDFGYIRFDKYNQPAPDKTEPESWIEPKRKFIPRTDRNTNNENESDKSKQNDERLDTPWEPTSTIDTQGHTHQKRANMQLNSQRKSEVHKSIKTQNLGGDYNARIHPGIESYSDKQRVLKTKKTVKHRTSNAREKDDIFEKETYRSSKTSSSHGSNKKNFDSKNTNIMSKTTAETDNIFDKEYFGHIMDNELSSDSSKTSAIEKDENIFEEEYFSGLMDKKDSKHFFSESSTDGSAENTFLLEKDFPQSTENETETGPIHCATSGDDNLFEEQYFTPGNESAAQTKAPSMSFSAVDEEPHIEDNIFETQYFTENAHDSSVPWENKNHLKESINSHDSEISLPQGQSYEKKTKKKKVPTATLR